MSADDALLFIDANKYLDLYRTDKGKKLLAPLGEQVDFIFVTQRVVDEVQRNKIQVAADYLNAKFKELKLVTFSVPDHLTGVEVGQGAVILRELGDVSERLKKVNSEVDALALGILEQISRSKDEVSKALAHIFDRAIPHSHEELQRARERRELGNPPGKASNPIGDQVTWEQILSHFKGKKRLWIISRDGDYGTLFGGRGFINWFLYEELQAVSPGAETYLFTDTVEGITHFVNTTGVKAEMRLTPKEVEEIEEEEQSLPSLFQPLQSSDDVSQILAKLTKPSVDVSQILAKLTTPSVDASQILAKLTTPSVDVSQILAKLTTPSVDASQILAKLTTPSVDVSQLLAKLTKPNVGACHEPENNAIDHGIANEAPSPQSKDDEDQVTDRGDGLSR